MMNRLYTALAWCFFLVLVLGILGYRWLQFRRSQRATIWEFVDQATWKDECDDDPDAHENTTPVYYYPEPLGQAIKTETLVEDSPSDSELDFGQFLEMSQEREAEPPADFPPLAPTTPSAGLTSHTKSATQSPNLNPTPLDQATPQTQPVFVCLEPGCETKVYRSQGRLTQVPLPRPSYLSPPSPIPNTPLPYSQHRTRKHRKPNHCKECDKWFGQVSELNRHPCAGSSGQTSRYPCLNPGCEKPFTRPDNRNRHMREACSHQPPLN